MNFNKVATTLKISLGFFLKYLTRVVRSDRTIWVFGSGQGNYFNENSKYLYFHIKKNHPGIKPIWISKKRSIVKLVRETGGEAYYNYSFLGIYTVIRAGRYFFSTIRADIDYFFPGERKKVINLFHGMPIKKIIYDYEGKDLKKTPIVSGLYNKYVAGFMWNEIAINISTSTFFSQFLKTAFRTKAIVETGLPRNDLFFQKNDQAALRKKMGLPEGKFIISYLPTHRGFGKGKPTPFPFINNAQAKHFMNENNCVFVNKAHYNMNTQYDVSGSTCLLDVSKQKIDAQELLSVSDVLITDYSSCFVDFLLLDRPVLFYFYDSYQDEDTALYFDIENQENAPGKIHCDESALLASLQSIVLRKDEFNEPRKAFIKKYHTFADGNSCQRITDLCLKLN